MTPQDTMDHPANSEAGCGGLKDTCRTLKAPWIIPSLWRRGVGAHSQLEHALDEERSVQEDAHHAHVQQGQLRRVARAGCQRRLPAPVASPVASASGNKRRSRARRRRNPAAGLVGGIAQRNGGQGGGNGPGDGAAGSVGVAGRVVGSAAERAVHRCCHGRIRANMFVRVVSVGGPPSGNQTLTPR